MFGYELETIDLILILIIIITIITLISFIMFKVLKKNKNITKNNEEIKYVNVDIRKEERNVFFNSFIAQLGKRLADLVFIGAIIMIITIILIVAINSTF